MLIPFSKLYLSDANVRKTRNDQEDAQLSADIEARGLLQNLLVTNPSLKVTSVKELVALARAQPGALSYASGGAGVPGGG